MSTIFKKTYGNGKRHSIPLPERPRKIKRITLEAFLLVKELLKKVKRLQVKKRRHYHKRPSISYKRTDVFIPKYMPVYEPSKISDTYGSVFWQWRRVSEWEGYVNDPLENKPGHNVIG